MNFYSLWLITCTIDKIIQKTDIIGKHIYYYKLFIKRNDELSYYKTTTFDKIKAFRNYIIKYVKEIVDIPFPQPSILAYIPIIGRAYSDDNNDVLIEKKYVLDNFFKEMLKNQQVYKLEEFKLFFTED
jgi:hypothetical protein